MIHHLEVSKQGFVLAVWKDPNKYMCIHTCTHVFFYLHNMQVMTLALLIMQCIPELFEINYNYSLIVIKSFPYFP